MRKITLTFVLLLIGFLSKAQTITQSTITSAIINTDGDNEAISWSQTPATALEITLTNFTADTEYTVYNQFRITDVSGDQWAGGSKVVTTDASGNVTFTFSPGFFGGAVFTGTETIGFWKSNTSGIEATQTFSITLPSLATKETYDFNTLKLTPNPTTGLVNISGNNSAIDQVEVYNTLGENIGNDLDLSTYENGLYFIKIYSNGKSTTKQIIKK